MLQETPTPCESAFFLAENTERYSYDASEPESLMMSLHDVKFELASATKEQKQMKAKELEGKATSEAQKAVLRHWHSLSALSRAAATPGFLTSMLPPLDWLRKWIIGAHGQVRRNVFS